MAGKFGFQCEEHECHENQGKSRVANWQDVESEDCQYYKEKTYHPGNNRTGMIELNVQRKQSNRQQYKRHVRVHQERKYLFLQGHIERLNGVPGCMQHEF